MPVELLIRHTKRAWHRDLVARPDTHAWVLNLYRAGERHPQLVLDYFPVAHAPTRALGDKLTRHRDDEIRHTRMYEGAIAQLDQPLEEFTGADVFNNAIRAHTPASFAVDGALSADERARRVAHFLAHAYYLESRIHDSLELHLEACAPIGRAAVTAVVERVYTDEARHTSYTRTGVLELLGRAEGERVLALHRDAESRANRVFSARQVRSFLRRFPNAGRATHRALYAAGALLMQGGLPRA